MKMVSIVVPIYNVEKYLEECIQSVLGQTYSNLEIILVNDGSTDSCGKICECYKKQDSRIQVLHKKNGGLADARNEGVKIATGEYLIFVDSDDYIDEKAVEVLLTKAEETGSDIIIYDMVKVSEQGEFLEAIKYIKSQEAVFSVNSNPRALFEATPSSCNKCFRREFWEREGFEFPLGMYYEDLGTIPKLMLKAEKISYVEEGLYYYRTREGSIMHQKNYEKNFADKKAMIEEIIEFYKQQKVYEKYYAELEFIALDNGYFLPCKEIVLEDTKSIYLKKYREYMDSAFLGFAKNKYTKEFSRKNKILFWLLNHRLYKGMLFLSLLRRAKDKIMGK